MIEVREFRQFLKAKDDDILIDYEDLVKDRFDDYVPVSGTFFPDVETIDDGDFEDYVPVFSRPEEDKDDVEYISTISQTKKYVVLISDDKEEEEEEVEMLSNNCDKTKPEPDIRTQSKANINPQTRSQIIGDNKDNVSTVSQMTHDHAADPSSSGAPMEASEPPPPTSVEIADIIDDVIHMVDNMVENIDAEGCYLQYI